MTNKSIRDYINLIENAQQAVEGQMPKTWHDVDPELGRQVDQMSQAEKVNKGLAHPDTLNTEQVYKVVALDKGNALKKPTKMKVKASSIEDLFSRLSANDWYPLEINGVEVIAGKRLKKSVAEETGMEDGWYVVQIHPLDPLTGRPNLSKVRDTVLLGTREEADAYIERYNAGSDYEKSVIGVAALKGQQGMAEEQLDETTPEAIEKVNQLYRN
jgi:hypothetical protein